MLNSKIEAAANVERGNDEKAIGAYAIIGDCRTAALVSDDGSIDWLCLPHFWGRSVFAALLDQTRGGRFRIRPASKFRSKRRYCGPTAGLEATFEKSTGSACVADEMPTVEGTGTLHPLREVLRVVEGIEGDASRFFGARGRTMRALTRASDRVARLDGRATGRTSFSFFAPRRR